MDACNSVEDHYSVFLPIQKLADPKKVLVALGRASSIKFCSNSLREIDISGDWCHLLLFDFVSTCLGTAKPTWYLCLWLWDIANELSVQG